MHLIVMDTTLIWAPLIIAEKLELQHSRPKRNFSAILSCFYSECDVAEPGGTAWHRAARASSQVATSPLKATPCGKNQKANIPTDSQKWMRTWHRLARVTGLSCVVRGLFKMYNEHT